LHAQYGDLASECHSPFGYPINISFRVVDCAGEALGASGRWRKDQQAVIAHGSKNHVETIRRALGVTNRETATGKPETRQLPAVFNQSSAAGTETVNRDPALSRIFQSYRAAITDRSMAAGGLTGQLRYTRFALPEGGDHGLAARRHRWGAAGFDLHSGLEPGADLAIIYYPAHLPFFGIPGA
jgi:hypothetical protein